MTDDVTTLENARATEPNYLICPDGSIAEITKMLKAGGERTDDPAQATAIVLRMPAGKWGVRNFKPGSLQTKQLS